jgi:hypothetical protein
VHYIDVVWKKKVLVVGEPSQARYMSPHVVSTISFKTTLLIINLESLYLGKDVGRALILRDGAGDLNTFREVLFISSQFMVLRQELTMFVERRILATLGQPGEHHICLACWARELPVNTPRAE